MFPFYFRETVPRGELSAAELDDVLVTTDDAEAFAEELRRMAAEEGKAGRSKANTFLQRFSEYLDDLPDEDVDEVVHGLKTPFVSKQHYIHNARSTATMAVIGDVSFPGDHFILNEVTDIPTIDIEIKSAVAHVDEGLTPYFWITASDMEEVDRKLTADPTVTNIEQLENVNNNRLYRAQWVSGSQGLLTVLQDTEGAITTATFHNTTWKTRFLFRNREQLAACFEQCRDDLAFDIELLRVFDRSTSASSSEYGLTEAQRKTLQVALAEGYFEVPREGNITDVAQQLGVSQQAVSQRLLRGYESLVMNTIGTYENSHID